jgi:hypothetical protein
MISREAKSLGAHFYNDSFFYDLDEVNWHQLIDIIFGSMVFSSGIFVALSFVKDQYR